MPLKDMRIGALLHRVASIMREHSIVMPADLTMMFKALITLEGLGRQYDPEFQLVDHLPPFLSGDRRALPTRRGRAAGQSTLGQFFDLVSSVPRDLARLLRDARRGGIRIDLDMKRLDSFGEQARRGHRPHHHGHHDRLGRDRLLDRDDGAARAPGVRRAAVHLLGLLGYVDGVLQQRLGDRLDLALRTAMTERRAAAYFGC